MYGNYYDLNYNVDLNLSAILFIIAAILIAVNTRKTSVRVISIIAASISFIEIFIPLSNLYGVILLFGLIYYGTAITLISMLLKDRRRLKGLLITTLVFYCAAAFFSLFGPDFGNVLAFVGSILFLVFTGKVINAINRAKYGYREPYNDRQRFYSYHYRYNQQNQNRFNQSYGPDVQNESQGYNYGQYDNYNRSQNFQNNYQNYRDPKENQNYQSSYNPSAKDHQNYQDYQSYQNYQNPPDYRYYKDNPQGFSNDSTDHIQKDQDYGESTDTPKDNNEL